MIVDDLKDKNGQKLIESLKLYIHVCMFKLK